MVFCVVNLADIITAMYILPGEANPIYLLTGSAAALWAFKLAFMGLVLFIYFKNDYPSRFWFFSYIYLLVIGTFMMGVGVFSNVLGILNPATVQAAAEVSATEKMNYYSTLVTVIMAIPYAIAMIAFKIYDVAEKNISYATKKKSKVVSKWRLMFRDKK